MQQVQSFFQGAAQGVLDHYPNRFSLVGAVFCASAAAEIAIKTVGDLYSEEKTWEGDRTGICNNFALATFYGLCAWNVVPGTAIIGAIIAIAQHVLFSTSEEDLLLSPPFKFTGNLLGACNDFVGFIDEDSKGELAKNVEVFATPYFGFIGIGLLGVAYQASRLPYQNMWLAARIGAKAIFGI